MFIVTNREVDDSRQGLDKFGKNPNPLGPNELRLVEATKSQGKWRVRVLPDRCDEAMMRSAKLEPERDESGLLVAPFASRYVARKVLSSVRRRKRNLLFFVHGFNNDVEDVLDRCDGFARNFGLEVIAFSWPANGGGARGVASYKSDKRDARASIGALDRAIGRMHDYLDEFNRDLHARIRAESERRFPDNAEERNRYVTEEIEKACGFTVNLTAHSMGNYLYKNLMLSSVYRGPALLFDNVVLVAADTNSEGHEEWVDRISTRSRVFVAINEKDSALMASRVKAGEEQKARLGHCPYNLSSRQAVYVDFTGAPRVGRSHAYFEGDALRNVKVKRFFLDAFNGRTAESGLRFEPATRLYKVR